MKPTNTNNPDYFHKVVDCQWACPAHTDVPEYIRKIAQGEFTDAYIQNRESNIFPGNQSLGEDLSALQYGVSITDACIGWDETAKLVKWAHQELQEKQPVS